MTTQPETPSAHAADDNYAPRLIPIQPAAAPAPIICKGTATQRPCAHYKAGGDCTHPENMRTDYVNGGTRPFANPSWRRMAGEKCGPLAIQYDPVRAEIPW